MFGGPALDQPEAIAKLSREIDGAVLAPIYETIGLVKRELACGICGSKHMARRSRLQVIT
jgi:hypothetical protein